LKRAGVTLGRTLLNATIGLGGIFDVAGRLGLEHHNEDAGQTLAVYGVPPVAYVELPFFGPSTVRGTGGFAADNVTNPITWGQSTAVMATDQAINFMGGIDIRARNLGRLEDIKRGSVDYYAAIKSLWWQNRRNEIMNGRLDTDALPDFDFEDFEIEPESE
jgi:phospholipid-binding lipoprotein MlaA